MSSTNEPWFVAERSEALAGVLLTSRKDVRIRDERKHDSGLDFLVEIYTGDPLSTQLFVVEVKGPRRRTRTTGCRTSSSSFAGTAARFTCPCASSW